MFKENSGLFLEVEGKSSYFLIFERAINQNKILCSQKLSLKNCPHVDHCSGTWSLFHCSLYSHEFGNFVITICKSKKKNNLDVFVGIILIE